jgi:hypothetical protein
MTAAAASKTRTIVIVIAAALHDVVVLSFELGTQRFGTLPKRTTSFWMIMIGTITRGTPSSIIIILIIISWNVLVIFFFFEIIRIGTINIHFENRVETAICLGAHKSSCVLMNNEEQQDEPKKKRHGDDGSGKEKKQQNMRGYVRPVESCHGELCGVGKCLKNVPRATTMMDSTFLYLVKTWLS